MVLAGLAERLTTDPRNLSPPSEFEDGEPGRRRPTRILILDEGVADTLDGPPTIAAITLLHCGQGFVY